jgi:hypothetical protein
VTRRSNLRSPSDPIWVKAAFLSVAQLTSTQWCRRGRPRPC